MRFRALHRGRLATGSAYLCLIISCILAAFLLALGGCAFSETITQKIYDSNPNNEVDTTAQKVLNNTLDAEKTSDQLPQLSVDNSKEKQETDQDLPTFGEGASSAPTVQPLKSESAVSEADASKSRQDAPTDASGGSVKKSPEGNASKSGGNQQQGEEKKSPENEGPQQTPAGKGKNKDNEVKVYADYGDYPEIPKGIEHIAAVGDAAVIVSMLGGESDKTPLVFADEEFVNGKQTKKVLASRGISKVKALWDDDGTEKDSLSSKGLAKLIESDVELCYVMEGDETLTDKQREKLLDANIIVYELPSMASASRILSAVKIVGDTLEEGGNDAAGKRAAVYKSFHNGIISSCKKENGGITGGFNYDKGKKASTKASDLYTLVITDWDESARYSDENGFLRSTQGAAIADLGYEEKPNAYYLSVGGVNNNAAAGYIWRAQSGKTAVAWQFTTSQASLLWKQWSSIDRSKVTYEPAGQGFSTALMWSDDAQAGLGTEEFPAVIVASQEIKGLLEKDAKRENGLYHPYPLVSNSKGGTQTVQTVGFVSKNLVHACIGAHDQGSASVLNDGKGDVELYDIHVNPCGLFSSWLDGSVESVLESAWAYKTFRDEGYDLEEKITEFYSSFYGYDLTGDEIKKILAGSKKVAS